MRQGKLSGSKVTRKDCMTEIAAEGQYPGGKHKDKSGRVIFTPGIQAGCKVYFTIEGTKKVIHFIDRE